ncbi:hypothetical protein MRB53_032608 [Persea americana]|uniref:Uncharacterized protein n=1 Tax=Persea americana TaxID=3435 RepID=A0ACC2KSK0_PERAE|nr:hypothetical protein MRB53_032608 [Persea americana]
MLQEAQVVYLSGGSLQTFTTNMMGLQDGYQMGSSKLRCPAFDHPSKPRNLVLEFQATVYKPSFCEENIPKSFSIPKPLSLDLAPFFSPTAMDFTGKGSSPPLFFVFQQRLEALAGVAIGGSFDTARSTTLPHSSSSLSNDQYDPSSF